jgi:hypothetical protein
MQDCQEKKGNGKRNRMNEGNRVRAGNIGDEWTQDRSQRGFAERAEAQARQRDSHLNARNNTIELPDQVQNYFRPKSPLIDQLPDARMAHRNQRKLDRREKSIHGHQSEQSEESQSKQAGKFLRGLILAAHSSPLKGPCASVIRKSGCPIGPKIHFAAQSGCFISPTCIRMLSPFANFFSGCCTKIVSYDNCESCIE